ncbi:MAG: GntR family transcriptional regulator [Tissierellia bacterium]|nr:GntR family transcriptional regulator [Tissierellia bacterium]
MLSDSKQPIYIQIINDLKKQMASGKLCPGDKLLPVRDMALNYKVNPNTIQRSYQELERDGIITVQRGVGSFVTDDDSAIKEMKYQLGRIALEHFFDEMSSIGYNVKEIVYMVNEEGGKLNA